eukprot:TRINITY_DN11889_c0_g1_i1.p1 TRINITY_DN11889_c0_g1~~TRINITY_DN11889_c0_g1_i1.p1  ORF type:complete len:575 (-),score=123.50 TRINITY_DN11889_c0_g1_i1:76-1800(-)
MIPSAPSIKDFKEYINEKNMGGVKCKKNPLIVLRYQNRSDGKWDLKDNNQYFGLLGVNEKLVLNRIEEMSNNAIGQEKDDISSIFSTMLILKIIEDIVKTNKSADNHINKLIEQHYVEEDWRELADEFLSNYENSKTYKMIVDEVDIIIQVLRKSNRNVGKWKRKNSIKRINVNAESGNNEGFWEDCEACNTKFPRNRRLGCPRCYSTNLQNKENEYNENQSSIIDEDFTLTVNKSHDYGSIDLNKIDWSTSVGCKFVNGGLGSSGVYLVEFSNDDIVVIKAGGNSTKQELFAWKIGKYLGYNVPNIQLVLVKSNLGRTILTQIKKIPFENKSNASRVNFSLKQFKYLYIMEYIPGHTLSNALFRNNEDDENTDNSLNNNNYNKHENENNNIFVKIGKFVTYDILINNFDRINMIHKNDGNPDNLIITKNNKVYGIDQALCSVNIVGSQFETYKALIQPLFDLLFHNSSDLYSSIDFIVTENQHLMKYYDILKQFFFFQCNINFQISHFLDLLTGLKVSFHHITSIFTLKDHQSIIKQLSEEINSKFKSDFDFSHQILYLENIIPFFHSFKYTL